jgi:hypothetical protein
MDVCISFVFYLVSNWNSSPENRAVLDVVNKQAGVVQHLDDVTNF